MRQKILITGINGFVGKHLARELSANNITVIGVGQQETSVATEIESVVSEYYQCDITQPNQVANLPLDQLDAIINLAGLANVGASFDNPELYMNVNVKVLSVLGSALHKANPSARIVAVSSGALYDPNQPMPLNEESLTVTKSSPYSLSKLAMEDAAQNLRDLGQDCIVVRPFNHIGPGQGLGFLIPDLANKLKQADANHPAITAGNLNTVRDFTDVRDIVKAYALLATSESLTSTLYNVCSGEGHSGQDIVQSLCTALDIDFEKLTINVDQSLIRPTDPPRIIGDKSRLTQDTSWQPSISLERTINDIVESLWTRKN